MGDVYSDPNKHMGGLAALEDDTYKMMMELAKDKPSLFNGKSVGIGDIKEGFDWEGLLGDKYKMGNITGLASTLMQAAALPSMLKQAKLQNQSLAHNLATAKEEQSRRNKNISGFNQPRSAFTQQVV